MATMFSELTHEPNIDPDAQATVTDFIDYTEFFPSELFRSLGLIGKLDSTCQIHTENVHNLTKTYGSFPNIPTDERPDPQQLRRDISHSLDNALKCRESSFAEAARLCDVVDNLSQSLSTIRGKLEALPKPPSRDPSPAPKTRSPNTTRTRKIAHEQTPRLKLIGNKERQKAGANTSRPKNQTRRIVYPGEVLPPFDPNSPGAEPESDSEPEAPPSPAPRPPPIKLNTAPREKTPKLPKPERIKLPKISKKEIPPGVVGTNVHSAVAGISVSNAMAQLEPPPPNPQIGSRYAPWNKLTEWELHKLRKKMKKNADWMPSDIMIKRELAANGRGAENYVKAKNFAEERGEELVDEEPEAFIRPLIVRPQTSDPRLGVTNEEHLVNRGMKLNEAKKLKREMMLKEQAAASQRIADAGLEIKNLFSGNHEGAVNGDTPANVKRKSEKSKKRKREDSRAAEASNTETETSNTPGNIKISTKKIKLAPTLSQGNSEILPEKVDNGVPAREDLTLESHKPLRDSSDGEKQTRRASRSAAATSAAAAAAATTVSEAEQTNALQKPVIEDELDRTRQNSETTTRSQFRSGPSLKLKIPKKAASAEPEGQRASLRRASNASLPGVNKKNATSAKPSVAPQTAASRRAKRPAPGLVITNNKGGTKVSLARRKSAPAEKSAAINKQLKEEKVPYTAIERTGVEEDDESYCLCGRGSFGRMIACEDPNCEREWFHFGCVGLDENSHIRFAREVWYCPGCRLKHGVKGDGIAPK